MSLSIGIVGLPNVGKSTLFKALTRKIVDIANYPFCTIDPNVGVVSVPDARLDELATMSRSIKVVPAAIEFVDIAGLVAGAHKGEGLGNKFLSYIREVDAICQVVRDFKDDNIIHVNGVVNPASDMETINTELALADLEIASKRVSTLHAAMKGGHDKKLEQQLVLYERVFQLLEQGKLLSSMAWTEEERVLLRESNFLTLKPMLYVLNVSEEEIQHFTRSSVGEESKNGAPPSTVQVEPGVVLPLCIKLEAELSELPENEARAYLQELGVTETGLDKLIVSGYARLDLITYLTTGEKETRAWTIPRGTKAPQAAGKIHTDFETGFIVAETVPWKDLLSAGGWLAAREKGLIRSEGKEYVVQDGDVMIFRVSK